MRKIMMVLALAIPAGASAQAGGSILDRAVKVYEQTRSARAEFRQTLTNPLTGSTTSARGVLLRRHPNLLSITFEGAQGDRVVADGKALWFYSPASAPGQVMKLSSKDGRMASVDPGSQILSSPRTKYTISEQTETVLDGRKTHVLSLISKSRNSPFGRARVWIDDRDATVRQFETVDANGLTRLIRIVKWQANAAIPGAAFRFVVPPGVRVVDQASMGR